MFVPLIREYLWRTPVPVAVNPYLFRGEIWRARYGAGDHLGSDRRDGPAVPRPFPGSESHGDGVAKGDGPGVTLREWDPDDLIRASRDSPLFRVVLAVMPSGCRLPGRLGVGKVSSPLAR